jgi:hypothetical protein
MSGYIYNHLFVWDFKGDISRLNVSVLQHQLKSWHRAGLIGHIVQYKWN